MKNLILLAVILFLHLSSYSQGISFNLKNDNLKGQVHTVYHKTFKVRASGEMQQKYAVKSTYATNGDLTSVENYGYDTKLDSKELYNYKGGKLEKISLLNSVGKEDKTTQFSYNNKQILIAQKKQDSKRNIEHETTYKYNEKGLLLSKTKTIPSIDYTMTESYVYDNRTNQMVVKAKKARIGATKETFEYNKKGLVSKKSEYNAIGELFSVITYKYNKNNDKISLDKFNPKGEKTYFETYDYVYDVKGNWIKRISFEKGKKVSQETRDISYY
jgi:hypothetical protein